MLHWIRYRLWLFTIGFLHLTFWQGVLAVVLWPYYLRLALRPLTG